MGDADPQAKRPKLEDDTGESTEIRAIDLGTSFEDDNSHVEDDGIPTLVVERLIESITDVAVLKICRLVDKYWNSEACKRLKKISEAVIPEDDPNINKLLKILKAKSIEPLLSLPSPFKEANVTAMEFKNKSFRDVLLHPYWEINTLSMSLSEDIANLDWLAKFLREKTKQLKYLTITSFNLNTLYNVLRGVKLPMLKDLTVNESCENELCAHMGKLADSLQDSALESLKITISSFACFVFWRSLNFSQLKELNVGIDPFHLPDECWDMLARVHMPALTDLTISSSDPNNDQFQEQISSFIRNVSPKLEHLEHNFVYDVGMDYVFSKLECFIWSAVTPPTFMEYLTTERFPCLTQVSVIHAFLDSFHSTQFESHDQVKIFWAHSDDSENDQEEFPSFSTWITTLKKKFPNLIEFGLEINIWNPSILLDIHRVYPHLKSIYMYGIMDFVTLSGGSVEQVAIERVGGISEDSDESQRISLMDFIDLETVILYPVESDVSNDLIRFCLSRLPKLKELDIPWNSELSVEIVSSYLQHLETLEIRNFDEWDKTMAELDKALPRTEVRKSY